VAAPKGNTNAEKWTEELAIDVFTKVEGKSKDKFTYSVNGKSVEGYLCHYIGEAADEGGTTIDILEYIRDKYSLQSRYAALKRKCERNCFTDTKKGIINTAAGIVNLKSNHGWTDRVDNTSKGNELKGSIPVSKWIEDQMNDSST
jgi:hypothetical protein